MMRLEALLIAVAFGLAALVQSRQAQAVPAAPAAPVDPTGSNFFTGAFNMLQSQIDNVTSDPVQALNDANVLAFLHLIRVGEGTADAGGYIRLFGGRQFSGFADHPRIHIPFGSTYTTAAGAYQIIAPTWDEMAAQYNLADFSPGNQDIAAVGLIKRRGALGDVIAGRFATAINKCNQEWASLPNSPYGQPTLSMAKAATILAQQGVISTEAMA